MWNSRSDVLVLVLVRLPPKSLGRCKSVSRSWNVLISSTEFIRFHLEYQSSIQKKVYRLLTRVVDSPNQRSHETHLAEYSINGRREDYEENLELGCEIQRVYNPYESHARGMTSMFVGSCNGLICQTLSHIRNTKQLSIYGEYEISLCNPLTKSTWVLPESPLLSSLKDDHRVVFYGFGYDDVHDTYKVFLASGPPVNEYQYRPDRLPDAKYEYQVFNLRSNKWIMVSSDHLDDFHDYFFHCPIWKLDGVLINCALHWILRNPYYGPNQNKNKNYILAFDLRVDKLNILLLPEAADEYYDMLLIALNGCLLLCDHIDLADASLPESIVDMWLMKDYGLKDSWTRIRIRNSPYHLCFIAPVALLEDNHHRMRKLIYHDIRCYETRGMILLSYDIDSHQVVELPTPPSAISFHSLKQLQFVASLVHPHPPSSGDKKRKYIQEAKKTMAKYGPSPLPRKKLRGHVEI